MLECVRLALRGGDTAPAYEQPQFDGCIRTMTHRRTDASVDRGCIRCLAPAHTARRLATSGRVEEGRSGQQSTRDDADALSLVRLLSASVLRVPDELPGLSLCSSKGAQRVGEVGRCSGYWF